MSYPKENISPEERLLRIIKGQSKKEKFAHTQLSQAETKPFSEEPKIIRKTIEGRGALHKERLSALAILQRINTGLFLFWCLLSVGLFVFIKKVSELPQRYAIDVDRQGVSQKGAAADEEALSSKPFSEYIDIIGTHNLFKIYEGTTKTQTQTPAQIAPSDLLGSYALAGIISGDNPQAIIEDKKTKNTYFLNKGQNLGNFKIEEILEGKVILELKGQRFELSL